MSDAAAARRELLRPRATQPVELQVILHLTTTPGSPIPLGALSFGRLDRDAQHRRGPQTGAVCTRLRVDLPHGVRRSRIGAGGDAVRSQPRGVAAANGSMQVHVHVGGVSVARKSMHVHAGGASSHASV